MKHMNMLTAVIFALVILLPLTGLAQDPFDDSNAVKVTIQGKSVENAIQGASNDVEKNLKLFKVDVEKGLEKAGKSLDSFSKEVEGLIKKMKDATAQSSNGTAQGGTTTGSGNNDAIVINGAQAGSLSPNAILPVGESGNAGYEKGEVGDSFKNFWESVKTLGSSLGKWGSAFWEQITGPSKEEAPISYEINKIKTDFRKWSLGNAWDNFVHSGGELFGAVGRFVKSLFS